MSGRLKEVIQQFITKKGLLGRAQLSVAVGRSENTLNRWLREGIPSAHEAYKLARACGLSEAEALELAKECPAQQTG